MSTPYEPTADDLPVLRALAEYGGAKQISTGPPFWDDGGRGCRSAMP